MRLFCYLLPCLIFLFSFHNEESFKSSQMKFDRVKRAYEEKEKTLKMLYKEKNVNYDSQQIFLRIFKKEEEMELWARSKSTDKYVLIKTYSVCSSSGVLGPKRKKGDYQTPEGFYHIDRFNPQSSFYLSLGINYPNMSDKLLGDKNPGGDIFIHGSCVTIGCIPLTDAMIKEVYLIAIEAKDNGQTKIPAHFFPFRMNDANFSRYKKEYCGNKKLVQFWENLKTGYDLFEKNKLAPKVRVSPTGKYIFE